MDTDVPKTRRRAQCALPRKRSDTPHPQDGGDTWSEIAYDAALIDPVCEGAIAQVGGYTLFSNPAMESARANLTVRVSADGGQTWPNSVRLGDSSALGDYSSIVQGALIRGGTVNPGNLAAGVLWGSCAVPWPFR